MRLRGGSFGTFQPSLQWDRDLGPVILRVSAEGVTSSGKYKFPFFDTTLVRENGDIRSLRLESALFGRLRRGDWRLRLYAHLWCDLFPLRAFILKAKHFPKWLKRKLKR